MNIVKQQISPNAKKKVQTDREITETERLEHSVGKEKEWVSFHMHLCERVCVCRFMYPYEDQMFSCNSRIVKSDKCGCFSQFHAF